MIFSCILYPTDPTWLMKRRNAGTIVWTTLSKSRVKVWVQHGWLLPVDLSGGHQQAREGRTWHPGLVQLPQRSRAAPVPEIRCLSGDGDGLRLGWDIGLQVGLQEPWELWELCHGWGRGRRPKGAEMRSWAMGRVGGAPGIWAGTARPHGACRALRAKSWT